MNNTYTKEQIRKSLSDWLLFKVITDKKGMIPDVDNFLAFLDKGVSIKEGQKQIVNNIRDAVVLSPESLDGLQRTITSSLPNKGDRIVIEDPMEGMVCDSCQ